jgi:fumarate reductase (CoM/CoB) subunit A
LELFTSAKICAENISKNFKTHIKINSNAEINSKIAKIQNKNSKIEYNEIIDIQKKIKKIMNENASIVKNEISLKNALVQINEINTQICDLNNFSGIKYDSNFVTLYETQSLAIMAKTVLIAAINRRYSIGAHFREDFPQTIANPMHTNVASDMNIYFTNPS